ncbi:MAG: flap endonuclease, partial [Deltaproteobacteria bacterium]|nr:flap endonuclease [Deltaproteobacteria bacterium]
MTRLHLVDGTFELFRAHFSQRPGQRDAMGRDVKATLGLASSLLQLLDD